MSAKKIKSYREGYYKSLEWREERSSIAFSNAQAVSIIVLRTSILLNAVALAALATAVATCPHIRFNKQYFLLIRLFCCRNRYSFDLLLC